MMKTLAIIAAALIGSVGVAVAPAAADTHTRVVQRTTTTHYDNDRGRSGWRWRTSCRTEYRHGHRNRVCRRVRYR